jgi:hypothetical protein
MNEAERFLLEWLSKEDWSAYGECEGKDLDALIARGLAELAHTPPSGRTGVRLTEAGWEALKQ